MNSKSPRIGRLPLQKGGGARGGRGNDRLRGIFSHFWGYSRNGTNKPLFSGGVIPRSWSENIIIPVVTNGKGQGNRIKELPPTVVSPQGSTTIRIGPFER